MGEGDCSVISIDRLQMTNIAKLLDKRTTLMSDRPCKLICAKGTAKCSPYNVIATPVIKMRYRGN